MDVTEADLPAHDSSDCKAVNAVLGRVGDKWSVLIISRLGDRTLRFNELKREVGGISQRMLTLTLRGLERDGLVTRTVFATVPPRVEYELTALGHSLREPVDALARWALEHQPEIAAANRLYDQRSQRS
ncbi:putative HTH-type transcriptional regulator YtcD [Methyloligella halotolerans]|uniref:Putative HTH-type transcriptional regulator YtcD n=1 Tax=Methyloligella halotolerans TaxID=1177755 RepID=A0A1E2RVK9_9HYPH|nr:helix-turn-helix domain-containing protein [Methyloligella halotolerans]ODA66253.1 putative HTH-type transcriptional regulator YtcD [Methyloligella halotolerans]